MSMKTPAEQATSNYCDTHRIFFSGDMCPDCRLEEWAEWHEPTDYDEDAQWIPLKEV
jgi:hypothetical protein